MEFLLMVLVATAVALIVFINRGVILENGKCPKCRKQLTLREGPYGMFWGCTGYPQCTYTRKAKKN